MRLKDKVAVITGAASGIGKATAELFVKEGAKVVIVDISSQGKKVAENLGKNTLFIETDLRKEDDIEKMIREAVELFGKIDILMNNAGVGKNILIENMSAEDWNNIVDTNLRSYFLCIKHAIPHMKKH